MLEEDVDTLRTKYKDATEKLRYEALYAVSRGKRATAIVYARGFTWEKCTKETFEIYKELVGFGFELGIVQF